MKNVIFTLYIDIPDNKLDNPAGFTKEGVQEQTNKSLITKKKLHKYKNRLIEAQKTYAKSINAEYLVYEEDSSYTDFKNTLCKYPQISEYDCINFYKHYIMRNLADKYDFVGYFDLDIIPNTLDSVFSIPELCNSIAIPSSNKEAQWGKTVEARYYNTCIRNPATKYWNTHAMLSEIGLDPERSVFNTGMMVSSSQLIKRLDYFSDFADTISLMDTVKNDKNSMYPFNIHRVFGYDNETVFSYLVALREIPIFDLDYFWHFPIRGETDLPDSKFYHVIDKVFARFF